MSAIITLAGTSIYENHPASKDRLENIRTFAQMVEEAKNAARKIRQDDECCAEIASIIPLKGKKKRVYLFASNTKEGCFAALIISEILKAKGIDVVFGSEYVLDLKFDTKANFEEGISQLLDKIFTVIQQEKGRKIAFNITAGFRGVIPYISTVAQVFGHEIIYDLQGERNSPIIIDPLPIEFDRGILHVLYPYLKNYTSADIPADIRKLLRQMGLCEKRRLTPLGKIALYAAEEKIYDRSILGFEMEYILFEYFTTRRKQAKRELDFTYEEILHSYSDETFTSDIDIYLANKEEFVWIEVKPISYLEQLNKIVKQFMRAQHSFIKLHYKRLNKYVVVIYGFNEPLERSKIKISNFVKRMRSAGIESEVFFVQLPLAKKSKGLFSKHTLQNLLQHYKIERLIKIS